MKINTDFISKNNTYERNTPEYIRFQKSKKIFFYKYRRLQKRKRSINSMKINTDFISKNNTYERNTPEYIVVHNTDNFAEGADAHAHALAQCRKNFQDMSAHYYVDDKEIIYQAADICRGCWHVGIDYGGELFGIVNNRNSIGKDMSAHYYVDDKEIIYQAADICRGCWHVGIDYGGELFGIVNNRNSIGIEMCVQKGYDFEKAFGNTVLLVKYLMNRTGIKADRVVQHYDVCLKNCPSEIRRHGAWERLKSEIGEKEILIPKTGIYRITAKVLIVIGNPLMLSPDFPPLHTGRESFPSSGVPSSVTSTF